MKSFKHFIRSLSEVFQGTRSECIKMCRKLGHSQEECEKRWCSKSNVSIQEDVESWDQQMTGDEDGNQYSVKKLYDFAKSKGKAVNVPIEDTDALEWWHKSYSEKNPEHMKRMMNADTSVPVLGIRYGKKLSIADGLNRIKKAHSVEGKTHIPVYIMDSEDMWGLAEPKDKEK